MKKIIFVNVEDKYFLSQRMNLAVAARKAGFDVIVASKKSDLHKQIIRHGFKYIDTGNHRSGMNIFREVMAIFRLVQIFRHEKPDIVHNISIKPVIYGSIAAKISRVPKTVNLINGLGYAFVETSSFYRKSIRFLVVRLYKLALIGKKIDVIFQNPDDRNYFLKNKLISEKNSHVILGSGVDTAFFSPLTKKKSNKKVVILFFGRMLEDKGIFYLIQAAKELRAEGVEFELKFVGEPDTSNKSSIDIKILDGWHESKLINYMGYRNDMRDLLRTIDIVVLPTFYREGVPLSLIEAASVGNPIITTNMPGCKEIVQDGYNGYLVPPKNSNALKDKIKLLIENKDLRNRLGANSRDLAVKLFSKEIVNSKTIKIYGK